MSEVDHLDMGSDTKEMTSMEAQKATVDSIKHDSIEVDSHKDVARDSSDHTRCAACKLCWTQCTASCMWQYHPLPPHPTRRQMLSHSLMCPPHGKLARLLTLCLVVVLVWGLLWGITGDLALPGGGIFALVVLVVCATIGGELVTRIKLPPLLGMLVVGFCLRNVPGINIATDINPLMSGQLRNMALGIILVRAGLGLDPVALRRLSLGVVRLAFIPCIAESTCAAVTAHYLLGFPWTYAFMLGFVLGAVSPAVVVPSMLSLHEQGLGTDAGIPTLIIAAASVDDVLAITGFGIALSAAFANTSIVLTVFKGPIEAVLGVVYGVVLGVIGWYLPHEKHTAKALMRVLVLTGAGLFAVFGSRVLDVAGAGPLGCLTVAFIAALRWRKDMAAGKEMPVSKVYNYLWALFQPVLFGLIGAEVSLDNLQGNTVGLGIAVLFISLTLRTLAAFIAVFGLNLSLKERLFIPVAWLPKATVQAAIGSVALDTARLLNRPESEIQIGIQLLTIAVLSIVVTAPLGAAAISLCAPCLLTKSSEVKVEIIEVTEECGQQLMSDVTDPPTDV